MAATEGNVLESPLPIYHRAIDWDALYKRYPVPDVFANTSWKWSPDEIRAFQNEQFLDLMKTGWQNEFYRRRWTAVGLEPGDIRGIEDIGKLPTFDSGDIKKDQEENPPFGLINGDVAWLYERGGFVTMLQAFGALCLLVIVAAVILPQEIKVPAARTAP